MMRDMHAPRWQWDPFIMRTLSWRSGAAVARGTKQQQRLLVYFYENFPLLI